MADDAPKSWFNLANVGPAVSIVVAIATCFLAVTTYMGKTDQIAVAMISVNARLDRLFEKVDSIPVDQSRLATLERKVPERDAQMSALDNRLRQAEQTLAGIIEASRQKLRP